MLRKQFFNYIKNIILPCLVFSAITGFCVSWAVLGFKWCTVKVIGLSGEVYARLRENPIWLIGMVLTAGLVSFAARYFFRRFPDAKGGGIPTAIAILRGVLTFQWLKNLVGVWIGSLVTFFMGVPLGNEGPSVQIGTSIGRAIVRILGRKNEAWDRYVMTGGACAGFSVATGAPLSGIIFAIEEAHHRISPMILMVSTATVTFSTAFSRWISRLIGVDTALFGPYELPTVRGRDLWIPAVVGIAVGFASVVFIYANQFLSKLNETKLHKTDLSVKVLLCLLLTLLCGYLSGSAIGTGHLQIEEAIAMRYTVLAAFVILLVRTVLMIFSNQSGITGGVFLPILAAGALTSSIIGRGLMACGMNPDYYALVVVIGMAACLSGTNKSPLTAIVFGLEALSLTENVLALLVAVVASFMVTECFGAHSLNESIIKLRVKQLNDAKPLQTFEATVKVSPGAFVIWKSIRDILWPNNLFVLALKHEDNRPVVDEHGEKTIYQGDSLHVRFSTVDYNETVRELAALVGNRDFVSHTEKTF